MTAEPIAVVGVVLAGGESRRFGADKLQAELGGRPVLDHAIEATATVADVVLVAGRPPGRWVVSVAGRGVPVEAVPDRVERGGPLVGLATALACEAGRSATLGVVVGGDMPLVPTAILERLLAALGDRGGTAALLMEGDRRRPLPMALRVGPGREAVEAALGAGRTSLLAALDRLEVVELGEPEWRSLDPRGRGLTDVDRPDDLERART